MEKKAIFKQAFNDTIPVLAGYIVLGIGFGILLRAKGIGIIYALVMSIFMYAGSMQYAAVGLISGGASYLVVAMTTLMVNCRHLFYGISMIEKYKGMGIVKPYLMFAMTDETYSLVVNSTRYNKKEDRRKYYTIVSALDHSYWITGCMLGALIGSLIKINTEGIDFSLTALFVTIFVEQWRSNKNHLSAILGVVITAVCLIVFGPEIFLIPSMILITVFLLLIRKKEEPKYG